MTDVAQSLGNGEGVIPALQRARKVWIDQDLCTGDGLCTEIVPELFKMGDDGLAYVRGEDGELMDDPGRDESLANIPDGKVQDTVEAAQECPGECIFITDEAGTNIGLDLFG